VLDRIESFVSHVCLRGIFGWRLWCVRWEQAVLCITGEGMGWLWMVGRIHHKSILQLG
jgi:hypothetical protein